MTNKTNQINIIIEELSKLSEDNVNITMSLDFLEDILINFEKRIRDEVEKENKINVKII
jgi:hypothetical protein